MKPALMLLSILFMFSCKSAKQGVVEDERLTLILQEGYFPVERPEVQVIEDMKTLKAFYARINQTRKPGLPIPEVDFTTQTILVACLGERKTSELPIMRVDKETENELVVLAVVPENTIESNTQAYPLCIYSLSNQGKKISLEIN